MPRGSEASIKPDRSEQRDQPRRKLLDVMDGSLSFADLSLRSRLAGQVSLFGGEVESGVPSYPVLPECEPFGRRENLAMEKEVMGIYVSDHPLRGFEALLRMSSTHTCASVVEQEEGKTVRIAGVIATLRTQITKARGEKMPTLVLE